MNNRRFWVGSIIVTIILIIILGMMYRNKMQEIQEEEQRLIEVSAQAAVFDTDIQELEQEKEQLWQQVVNARDSVPYLTLAFVNMSEDTYNKIAPMMEQYGYQGTIVWLASNPNLLEERYILDLIEKGWDVAVGGNMDTEESLQTIVTMQEQLINRGIATSSMCYTENSTLDIDSQEYLLEQGIIGSIQKTQYQGRVSRQILENGFYQMEYVPFFCGDNKLRIVIDSVVEQKAGYIITMNEVVTEEEEKENVNISDVRYESLLVLLDRYEEDDGMQVRRLCDQADDSIKRELEYQEQLSQYEEVVIAIDEQLEVLQEERDAAYIQWKSNNNK